MLILPFDPERFRATPRWLLRLRLIVLLALLLASAPVLMTGRAQAADTCDGFISPSCCCTTGACFVIPASDYVRLDDKRFRILRTGKVVEAKGPSPDGKARLCTYDIDSEGNISRIGHPDARPSCFYFIETGS